MTIANTFALYFCIGTIYSAYTLWQMHSLSKELDETEIEDEEDYQLRSELINNVDEMTRILKTPTNVIIAMFFFIALLWPYILYLDIRSYFRKDDEE